MSEKRFVVESVKIIDDCNEDKSRIAKVITDTKETYSYEDLDEIVHKLNEQQEHITHLEDTNDNFRIKLIEDIEAMEQAEKKIGEQQATISALKEENEQLRLELETHKHPLWSTREAEKKVNKLADSLADEVKKNGLLNEEINQLRIENMRLKKKGGDDDER